VKRRRKRSAATRRFWIAALFLAALGGAAWYLSTWPGLYPKQVLVVGNSVVTRDSILQRAAVDRHRNLWLQDAAAMSRRIEAIPYILTARIKRTLPADLTIVVSERAGYAIVSSDAATALVDRDLRVLAVDPPSGTLPRLELGTAKIFTPGEFLRGDRVGTLRDNAGALSAAHVPVLSVSLDQYGQGVAVIANGIKVLMGDDADLVKKASLVKPILAQVNSGGRRIAAIDLRAPATPVVVYAN
jgi:cell division protein FtsQ